MIPLCVLCGLCGSLFDEVYRLSFRQSKFLKDVLYYKDIEQIVRVLQEV
jgi:hypothetical protein